MAASLTTKTFLCNDGRSWTPGEAFASWVPFLDVVVVSTDAALQQDQFTLKFNTNRKTGC
uniref:Uncharacterized protein n=1 Tax=Oryza nivara TaxID=4536 RepID=A0A0E0IE46_ORYNI